MRESRGLVGGVALVVSFVGCLDDKGGGAGADVREAGPELDAMAEVVEPDVADGELDGVGDLGEVEAVDDTADSVGEVEVVEPVRCEEFFACDALLTADGLCPGRCWPVPDTVTCQGEVVLGVCHRLSPPEQPNETLDFGDFEVRYVSVPERAVVGESHELILELVNTSGGALALPLRWKDPQTWRLEDPSWLGLETVTLGPGESLAFTATITAQRATVFSGGGDIIVTLIFGEFEELSGRPEAIIEPRAPVVFPDSEPIACGGHHFPAIWCEGDCSSPYASYTSAVCCDDAFFPGLSCCDDGDCYEGSCVDGQCVTQAPWLGSANNLPIGNQRVRLVLVDSHDHFLDPCENHYEDLKDQIDFATVERWYADLARRRIGRETMQIEWVVTGGVATSDFLTGSNGWSDYSRELDRWLADRGCPMLEGYDKLIVSTSTLEFWGFGGLYFDKGHMAVWSPYNAFLNAHEMAHSFGARDLYINIGGHLSYPLELMGNYLSSPPEPGDAVAWGELGYADLDRNGVIDIAEYAAFPERLDVANLTATITTKNAIEFRWEFVGIDEDGVEKRVVIPQWGITFPTAGAERDWMYAGRFKTMVFDHTEVDLDAIRAAGEADIILRGRYAFTDRSWQRRVLELDRAYTVPVSVEE